MEQTGKQKNLLRLKLAILVNAVIVVLELVGHITSALEIGFGMLQYYTQDSNLLGLFAAAIWLVYAIVALKAGTDTVPHWVMLLKYMAACCMTVTLLVVLFVLGPNPDMGGLRSLLLDGTMLYHHFLCPVLAILSFLFLERAPELQKRHTLDALLPTLAYALVTVLLNVARVMEGPYPFLLVYEQPTWLSIVWCAVILGGAYGVAWLLRMGNQKLCKAL